MFFGVLLTGHKFLQKCSATQCLYLQDFDFKEEISLSFHLDTYSAITSHTSFVRWWSCKYSRFPTLVVPIPLPIVVRSCQDNGGGGIRIGGDPGTVNSKQH